MTPDEVQITYGPSHSVGLTLGPCTRWLPRITLGRSGDYWACRWTAQNGSFAEEQAATRLKALQATLAFVRYQRWPLVTRKDTA